MWTRLADRLRKDAEIFAETLGKESLTHGLRHWPLRDWAAISRKPHKRSLECPYCWIVDGTKSVLKPVLGTTEAISCSACGSEYPLEE
jgi:hypothetical protein